MNFCYHLGRSQAAGIVVSASHIGTVPVDEALAMPPAALQRALFTLGASGPIEETLHGEFRVETVLEPSAIREGIESYYRRKRRKISS